MENYNSTENPTLNTNQYTPGDSKPIVSTEVSADVDYKQMSKIIDKQLAKSSRAHVKELQKQFNRFIKDNKKNFDRLSRENGRLLKIVEDLQSSQRHLQHQLELHQEREKLAVLREQQDVKRIRDLEDRLSLLLLPPVQNKPINLDDPNRSEIAIQPAEIVETVEEPPEVIALDSALEGFPDVESLEVSIEEDLSQQPPDSLFDMDAPVAGPLPGLETDSDLSVDDDTTENAGIISNDATAESQVSDLEAAVKTSPFFKEDQSPNNTVEVSVEKSQTTGEERGEDKIDPPSDVRELAVDPVYKWENVNETDSDEEYGGSDDRHIEAGEEEHYTESETVVDNHMPESSPISADYSPILDSDEWMQPDSPQIEEGFAESGDMNKRGESGIEEEPTTEEIETVGEIPSLGIDSTPKAFLGAEENFDSVEEDVKVPIDLSLSGHENESDMDQSSSFVDSIDVEGDNEAEITDGKSVDDDIIELQDEISLEKPGIEIDDDKATMEDAVAPG